MLLAVRATSGMGVGVGVGRTGVGVGMGVWLGTAVALLVGRTWVETAVGGTDVCVQATRPHRKNKLVINSRKRRIIYVLYPKFPNSILRISYFFCMLMVRFFFTIAATHFDSRCEQVA